jgi:hypothetical protein
VRFSVWRMRLRAEAVFAMDQVSTRYKWEEAYRRHAGGGFYRPGPRAVKRTGHPVTGG